MNGQEPLLKIQHLSKTFADGVDRQGKAIGVRALKDLSFEIFPGEFLAVVGVNGSGKSTLIHCLGSFEKPDPVAGLADGVIRCRRHGQLVDIHKQIDWYRQNFVGVVFQAFHLLPNIRVWQNVEIPLNLGHCERFTVDRGERREAVAEVLGRLGMEHHFHSRVHQTSGGQRQRVAIARALVKRPSLILADEPTGNLDEMSKRNLVEILGGLAREGVAVLLVTHDRRYVDEFADRIITLEDGAIRAIETGQRTVTASAGPARAANALTRAVPPPAAAPPADESPPAQALPAGAGMAAPELPPSAQEEPAGKTLPPADVAAEESAPATADDRAPTSAAQAADELAAHSASATDYALEPPRDTLGEEDDDWDSGSQIIALVDPTDGAAASGGDRASDGSDASGRSPTAARSAARGPSLWARLVNPLKRIRLPGCDQCLSDLVSFSLRDAWESSLALVSNVIAILCGTVLTALLMGLLVGTDRFIKSTIPLIPNIDAVHTWVDYSTGAEPLTSEEFAELARTPGAAVAVPNIQQFTSLFKIETRETIVTLVSGIDDDPETRRLKLLKGSLAIDPEGWGLVINERVANELDNFNPMGLVGKKITLRLRRYERAASPEASKASQVLDFPIEVVGIVESSYKERVYGSLNMVRFVRDFSTGRSQYLPPAEGKVDVSQISPRTLYEGVRLHFADAWEAEKGYRLLKSQRGNRLDVYWPGAEMEYLRDVQTVAFLVFLGIGLLTTLAGSISVFNTLRASVAHKTSEIGILRALGVTRADIFFVYIFQSLLIAVLAGTAGLLLAWFLADRLNAEVAVRWEHLQRTLSETGGLFIIPPAVGVGIFAAVCLICVLAAAFPATWAAQRTPMDAVNQPGR